MKLRLDKYLADMGLGTRSEVKKAITRGLTEVNGAVVKKPECKVDTETDEIRYQGRPVGYIAYEYYMLNKPAGVISATEDPRQRTVIDLITSRQRDDLFPVGRLDKDTEGLLLITDDGALAHELLSPKKHVEKTYYARISGIVTEEDIQAMKKGVDIGEEKPTLPARLEILSVNEAEKTSEIHLTICEGKFHQVKRMMEAVGKKVTYLRRISMGSLTLEETLLPGTYRELTAEEVELLKKTAKKP